MNRRQFLRFAPIAASGLLVPLKVDGDLDPLMRVPAEMMPQPVRIVDTRPVFRLSQFILVQPGTMVDGKDCHACGSKHYVYTHGCRPAAFVPWMWNQEELSWANLRPDTTLFAATRDSVPCGIFSECPLNRGSLDDPHQHEDFRWEL